MVVESILQTSLESHAFRLESSVESSVKIITGITPNVLIWLQGSLAEFLMAGKKLNCRFTSWSDADLLIKFIKEFSSETEFAIVRKKLQLGLARVSETDAIVDFNLVDPFNHHPADMRFLEKMQKNHSGFLIFDNGKTSFPW